MATVTYPVAQFANGTCRFEFDYDDVTMKPTAFRCENDSDQPVSGTVTSQSTGQTVPIHIDANTTKNFVITSGIANRFDLSVQDTGSRVRLVGVSWNFEYPAIF